MHRERRDASWGAARIYSIGHSGSSDQRWTTLLTLHLLDEHGDATGEIRCVNDTEFAERIRPHEVDDVLAVHVGLALDRIGGRRCQRRYGEPDIVYRERIRLARDGQGRCDFCGDVKAATSLTQCARVVPGGGEAKMSCDMGTCPSKVQAWIEDGRRMCRDAEARCPTGRHLKLECDCLVDEAAIAAAAERLGPLLTVPALQDLQARAVTRPDGFDQHRIDQIKAMMLVTDAGR